MYEQGNPPLYQRPMPMEEFWALREEQIQALQLNNPQELMEETRHRRGMERDAHKSMLKQQEMLFKQGAKTKMYEIQECNNETRMEVRNGNGYIVEQSRLFSCRIEKIIRYKRSYTGENLWQIILNDRDGEIYSELYPVGYLQSVSKLRHTIFAKYDCTIAASQRNIAWKWLENQIIAMYEQVYETELPYLAGWFKIRDVWHFWTKTEETELLASEVISRYRRDVFVDLIAEDVVDGLSENVEIIAEKTDAEILLLLRLWVCLDNLESNSPPVAGLTLIGVNAVEIAKKCLRTMYSDEDGIDIVNLDADRIGQIREKVKRIQNTPVIYLSCEPENKSTQNRLAEVTSWMQTGYIEGTKVHGLFVFCLQEFSPSYPLDRTIVIDVSKVRIFDNFKSFSKMQSLLISIVENGGSYWSNEFENQYRKLLEEERRKEEDSIVPALEAMILTILRMLNLDEKRAEILKKEFYGGLHEIKRQMSLNAGTLLEIFRQGVEKMVSAGSISVIGVQEKSAKLNVERLYFDDEYYYFSKSILHKIAETLGFSRKAVLYVKQELSDNNWLKQYRKTTNRRSELEVDVMVSNNDKKIRISVLAVKREFWDKIGGISLFER